jgi:hypothetical protein
MPLTFFASLAARQHFPLILHLKVGRASNGFLGLSWCLREDLLLWCN